MVSFVSYMKRSTSSTHARDSKIPRACGPSLARVASAQVLRLAGRSSIPGEQNFRSHTHICFVQVMNNYVVLQWDYDVPLVYETCGTSVISKRMFEMYMP